MTHMLAVRSFQAGDAPAATAIVRGLPDYFTEDVPDKVEHDAASTRPGSSPTPERSRASR
jgi:hypothetical protein